MENYQYKHTEPLSDEGIFGDLMEYRQMRFLYESALKEIRTKLEILNEEFKVVFARNPIHHIESRLKSPQSMINKLKRRGDEVTIESAKRNLSDIGGVRVVCCYIDDVYSVAEMLLRQSDIKLVKLKDYIKEPNFNGYRSLHLDVQIPIFLSDKTEQVTIEIQLRTVAMDFWASLEHDLRYKTDKLIDDSINEEMALCADQIADIDRRMQDIYKRIQDIK